MLSPTCDVPGCAHSTLTGFHLGNDAPWAALCRDHKEEMADSYRLRASMRERMLSK